MLRVAMSSVVLCLTGAPALCQQSVGFELTHAPDGTNPPIEVGVWFPAGAAEGHDLPLIVISHGNGGMFANHADTAQALARAGFVVAAPTHNGDNNLDQSRAADLPERPRQLNQVIDFMIDGWDGRARLDPERIGAFGFSSGGFTVLVAAGGTPDLSLFGAHCAAHPDYYDCRLAAGGASAPAGAYLPALTWTHDARIGAIVVAAPAAGFTFAGQLAGVTIPVQLWQAGVDMILPAPDYVEPVRASLPNAPEYHLAAGADHFDFLAPCSANLAAQTPDICAPTPGFDRAAFHETLNAEVVRFFREALR